MNAFPPDNPEVSFNPEKMAPEFLERQSFLHEDRYHKNGELLYDAAAHGPTGSAPPRD